MIRPLTQEDLPEAAAMGQRFYDEADLSGQFDAECFVKNWTALLANDAGIILGAFKNDNLIGGIGAVIFPNPNSGAKMLQETFWFVAPEHRYGTLGLRLFREMKGLADDVADYQIMVHMPDLYPEQLKRYYLSQGFELLETHYMRKAS